jgi:hypothetical protein
MIPDLIEESKSLIICTLSAKTKVADLVQITPSDFKKSSLDAIQDNINEKYANKVTMNFSYILHSCSLTLLCIGHSEDRTVYMPLGCDLGK